MTTLSSLLLKEAANNRHGVVLLPQVAHVTKSDVESIFHVGVPSTLRDGWKSAAGGVSFDEESAILAGIGETVERYCAGIANLELKNKSYIAADELIDANAFSLYNPDQQKESDFPFGNIYSDVCQYSKVFNLSTNEEKWVPHPLIVLRDDYETGIPTSSGLAAGPTITNALLRASQELIERDALMTTWLHSLPGRSIEVPDIYAQQVKDLHGDVYVFDITPAYSPFPVIAVSGSIPQRGKLRFSLGVACRETLDEAITKAYLEWCQGIYFAGIFPRHVDTTSLIEPNNVRTFDEHAIYYTQNPDLFYKLPLFDRKESIVEPTQSGISCDSRAALSLFVDQLTSHNIDLYYRDLTTIDALQSGVHVVRVLSPDLVPIHSHHAWPFLGGTAADVTSRYPDNTHPTNFPNPAPHPLG